MDKREPYDSDLTDAQWRIIEPLLPPRAKEGTPRKHDLREIIDAILYKLKTGCHWRSMPHDFPKWQSVYHYFRRFRDDGTLVHIHDQLRTQLRRKVGRNPEPEVAIIDSKSVKTTEKGGHVATTVVS